MASVAASGSVFPTVPEAQAFLGAQTIDLVLTDDVWAAPWTDTERAAVVLGLESDVPAEGASWADSVSAWAAFIAFIPETVERLSDTLVRVTLPALGGYDPTQDETITITVPGSVLAGGSPLVAPETFVVVADVVEDDGQAPDRTLVIRADDRTLAARVDDRALTFAADDRILTIKGET